MVLPPESKRRRAQRATRAEIVASYRALGICELRGHSDCDGPLQVHEVVRRAQLLDAHINRDVTCVLCAAHHRLDTHRRDAELLGIRVPRWAYTRWGRRATGEARRIRRAIFMGLTPPVPFWHAEDPDAAAARPVGFAHDRPDELRRPVDHERGPARVAASLPDPF